MDAQDRVEGSDDDGGGEMKKLVSVILFGWLIVNADFRGDKIVLRLDTRTGETWELVQAQDGFTWEKVKDPTRETEGKTIFDYPIDPRRPKM